MFKSEETARLYYERRARYLTAMNGGTPDRIPIRFLLQEAAGRICGVDNQVVSVDYNQAFECTRKAGEILGCDAIMLNAIWSTYCVAKSASWRYLAIPGVDVNLSTINQFSEPQSEEDEYLHVSEYDEFISDPTAFLVNKWFSRATTRVSEIGEPISFDHNTALMSGALAYANYMNAFGPAAEKLKYESGIVSANAGMIKAPLDILMDKFRGYIGCVEDCIDDQATVRKACEALIPHIVANALGGADPNKEVPITIWAHRGCVPFINPEMFEKIYWPTLKPVFEEIISHGYQILFYGEGNWEAHYDTLRELPAGSIIYHLDKGSIEKAATLKDRFAVSGGLDYNVLANGTADDVRRYMKKLFEYMKPDGGYILDATALLLSDVKPENLQVAVDYTLENGVYSQSCPAPERGIAPSHSFDTGKRPPNVVRPWEIESSEYRNLSGNVELVKNTWKTFDASLYNYLWTTVLW